jgi:hypothetical protein
VRVWVPVCARAKPLSSLSPSFLFFSWCTPLFPAARARVRARRAAGSAPSLPPSLSLSVSPLPQACSRRDITPGLPCYARSRAPRRRQASLLTHSAPSPKSLSSKNTGMCARACVCARALAQHALKCAHGCAGPLSFSLSLSLAPPVPRVRPRRRRRSPLCVLPLSGKECCGNTPACVAVCVQL